MKPVLLTEIELRNRKQGRRTCSFADVGDSCNLHMPKHMDLEEFAVDEKMTRSDRSNLMIETKLRAIPDPKDNRKLYRLNCIRDLSTPSISEINGRSDFTHGLGSTCEHPYKVLTDSFGCKAADVRENERYEIRSCNGQ